MLQFFHMQAAFNDDVTGYGIESAVGELFSAESRTSVGIIV